MGRVITIVGNNGSGKTTLAKALASVKGYQAYFESHEDRPFQPLFSRNVQRYALPNQIDYLLRRAEQERDIRAGERIGVQDGGLDQDFFLYSRLFHHKGFLDNQEFALCQRAYRALRAGLPAPDLIVRLAAPLDLLRGRLQTRARMIDLEQIVTPDDLPILDVYLEEWLNEVDPLRVLVVDITGEDQQFSQAVRTIAGRLKTFP